MTISSTYSPAQASGNSVAVAFPFTFKTFDEVDLVVVLTSSAGVETTQVLTTNYTVALHADQNNNPGGTITMLVAPATGETLTIARELSALQETDIANGGGFYPEVLEDALDRLTMLSQQNADVLARSLRSSVAGGSVGDLPTVADRASKYLAFDANGDPVATSSSGSGPVISTFAETLLDDTTAAAMRTTLGLDDVVHTTDLGTGVSAALAINIGTAGAPVVLNGALGTPASGTLTNCTADGTNLVGYRNIPQNSQSAAYTTVLGDAGKHILHPTADNNARTFTIDSNANVAYPIGTAITFVNQVNTVTIAITSDTMVLAGAGTTGSRTLAANGMATAVKVAATTWFISGSGLT